VREEAIELAAAWVIVMYRHADAVAQSRGGGRPLRLGDGGFAVLDPGHEATVLLRRR
jgi:hypothetical protein